MPIILGHNGRLGRRSDGRELQPVELRIDASHLTESRISLYLRTGIESAYSATIDIVDVFEVEALERNWVVRAPSDHFLEEEVTSHGRINNAQRAVTAVAVYNSECC